MYRVTWRKTGETEPRWEEYRDADEARSSFRFLIDQPTTVWVVVHDPNKVMVARMDWTGIVR